MVAIDVKHCEIGTVSSRQDGSVAFRVLTPELRPSEAGALMGWHGKACRVILTPEEGPSEEVIQVDTERETKTAGQRLRAILFVLWKHENSKESFQSFYDHAMEKFIDHIKKKLPDQ